MLSTAEEIAPQGRQVRRNAARTAILQAARRVVARDGMSEFSLSSVAVEAGFGPSTVFGHFRNKDELLAAVVADDLASVAAIMRDSADRTDEHSELAGDDPIELEKDHAPKTQVIEEQHFEYEAPAPEQLHPVAFDQSRDMQAMSSADADSAAQRPVPVDAWLERRLRTFERGLSGLEQRMKDIEASASWAVSISKDTVETVNQRLDVFDARQTEALQNLTRRTEEMEMRQRGATAEMRAAMNDTATRIEILESARRPNAVSPATIQAENEEAPSDLRAQAPVSEDDHAYADAAQRVASAAELLADINSKNEVDVSPSTLRSFARKRVRLNRTHYLVAGCLAALAFVLGAFFAFYVGVAHGHELALAGQVRLARSAPVRTMAASLTHPSNRIKAATSQPAPKERLKMLAEQGNPRAQLLVGLGYLQGTGAASDQPLASQWMRRAAEQQQPMAEYWLATMYEHGDGLGADSSQAVRWYEAAAMQGNRKAMHALGVAYAEGRGTSKDYSQAARWFTRAASLGLVNSQFNLGVLYERGLGVPQSLLDAYKWYAIAAAQGDQESTTRVDVLKTQLSADDLAAAQRAAASFHADDASPAANTNPVLAELSVASSH